MRGLVVRCIKSGPWADISTGRGPDDGPLYGDVLTVTRGWDDGLTRLLSFSAWPGVAFDARWFVPLEPVHGAILNRVRERELT